MIRLKPSMSKDLLPLLWARWSNKVLDEVSLWLMWTIIFLIWDWTYHKQTNHILFISGRIRVFSTSNTLALLPHRWYVQPICQRWKTVSRNIPKTLQLPSEVRKDQFWRVCQKNFCVIVSQCDVGDKVTLVKYSSEIVSNFTSENSFRNIYNYYYLLCCDILM